MLFQKLAPSETPQRPVLLLGADPVTGQVFQYRPETHLWHQAAGFWGTLLTPGATESWEVTITPVPAAEVGSVWPLIPRLDRRRYRVEAHRLDTHLVDAHLVRTMAEMGLSTRDVGAHRVMGTTGLAALLSARGREWTTVARYGPETTPDAIRVARNRMRGLRRLQGPVETVLDKEAPATLLRVRHALPPVGAGITG